MRFNLPQLFTLLLSIIFIELLLLSFLRVGFYFSFESYADDVSLSLLLKSFFIGFRFDIQLLVLLNLPLLLFGGIKSISKYFWISYIVLTNIFIAILYVINFAYYDFFKRMVDSSIIRYIYDISEAYKMLEEGYPLYPSLLGIIVFTVMIFFLYTKLYKSIENKKATKSSKSKTFISIIFVVFYIFAGYGKFEFYPWRWSEAFYSSNNFLSYLASNPITYFVNTLKNSGVKYNEEATKEHYDVVSNFLDITNKDENKLSLVRIITPKHTNDLKSPNIIFVLGESTAYCRTSMSNNPLNPTPFLNSLAQEGLTYERYFTPHSGTARSVFTAMTGLSDVERMKTSSRNPMVVEQNMILNSLENYKKFYFIGGSLSWGNVRGVISNVQSITTREESSYKSKKNDVWGVSDADLLLEAHQTLKNTKKPFFAFIQLSGNHSPWTIPQNSYGFKTRNNISKEDLLKYSFDGKLEEFNGQSFMDHAIKNFFAVASKESYMENTIFIFVGDHGLPKQSKHMHPSGEHFTLNAIHTPLIIYAPKFFGHKKISYPVSAVDIMATIAGLSGQTYINTTFGRDILDKGFETKEHYAFRIDNGSNAQLSLIGDKYIYKVKADGTGEELYEYYYKTEAKNLVKQEVAIAKKMKELCLGIYESTRYTRFNNSTSKVKKEIKERDLK